MAANRPSEIEKVTRSRCTRRIRSGVVFVKPNVQTQHTNLLDNIAANPVLLMCFAAAEGVRGVGEEG